MYIVINARSAICRHRSATAAGAALLTAPRMIALTSLSTGTLAAKVGPRLPLTIGTAVVAIGPLLAL